MPDTTEIPHYSDLLLSELRTRCERNQKYSLRSFARDLKISPGFLSRVVRQEILLSKKKAQLILDQLKWTPTQKNFFILLVQYYHSPIGEFREILLHSIIKKTKNSKEVYFKLSREQDILVSEWHHLAVLELTSLPNFNSNPNWIAKKIGISKVKVKDSLRRLLILGLLYFNKKKLVRSHNRYWIGNFQSKQIRSFHKQHLELASCAIDMQLMEERQFIGSTFPVSISKVSQIKSLIQDFHEKILSLAEQEPPEKIYHLAIQLYRLDKNFEEKE